MNINIRYLPNQDPGDILEQIRTIPDVEVARTFIHPPAHVSRSNPYVRGRWGRPCAAPARLRGDERRPRRGVGRGLVPSSSASRRSSSGLSAPGTTGRRNGSRSRRWRATGRRSWTSCCTVPT